MARIAEQDLAVWEAGGTDKEFMLINEVRRLRDLIASAHPYLDAHQAPAELQDALTAEVTAILDERRSDLRPEVSPFGVDRPEFKDEQ